WKEGRSDTSRECARDKLPHQAVVFVHLDHPAVVRICKQRVAVRQATRKRDSAGCAACGKGGNDVESVRIGEIVSHFDGAIVVLVGDQNIAVGQQFGAVGIVQFDASDA